MAAYSTCILVGGLNLAGGCQCMVDSTDFITYYVVVIYSLQNKKLSVSKVSGLSGAS